MRRKKENKNIKHRHSLVENLLIPFIKPEKKPFCIFSFGKSIKSLLIHSNRWAFWFIILINYCPKSLFAHQVLNNIINQIISPTTGPYCVFLWVMCGIIWPKLYYYELCDSFRYTYTCRHIICDIIHSMDNIFIVFVSFSRFLRAVSCRIDRFIN